MAYITGTAADHTALWNTLLDFLQNNAALVAAGQAWTKVWEAAPTNEVVLKGPGLSGTEEVFVAMKRVDAARVPDESEIYLSACTGVIATATSYLGHVNSLSRPPRTFLAHSPMQYWMVANGRRFVVVIKISTIYQAMYGGFFLPYGSPTQYPYPMFVGGSTGFDAVTANYRVDSWREDAQLSYNHFVFPLSDTNVASWRDSPAMMLRPEGTWLGGTYDQEGTVNSFSPFLIGPRAPCWYLATEIPFDTRGTEYETASFRFGSEAVRAKVMTGLNGEIPLTPATLFRANRTPSPEPATFGVLDGVYIAAGVGNFAENIVTIGGINHLVVPNVMRTGTLEYWALGLE